MSRKFYQGSFCLVCSGGRIYVKEIELGDQNSGGRIYVKELELGGQNSGGRIYVKEMELGGSKT